MAMTDAATVPVMAPENRADDDHRIRKAARHGAEQLARPFKQVLGQTAALEDRAHEREERDRQQQVVRHDAEQPERQVLQIGDGEEPLLDADHAEEQSDRGERECDREPDQHEDDQSAEHQRRHDFQRNHRSGSGFGAHCCGASYLVSSLIMPLRAAMRLISSEKPWNDSSTKPIGSRSFTGQRIRPPALPDISSRIQDS